MMTEKSCAAGRATERNIKAMSDNVLAAARVLIGVVRISEASEGVRSNGAELSLDVQLTGGGTETWKITIERTASSH
jgi:hypothetical protein